MATPLSFFAVSAARRGGEPGPRADLPDAGRIGRRVGDPELGEEGGEVRRQRARGTSTPLVRE